jgi:hypothetical protein
MESLQNQLRHALCLLLTMARLYIAPEQRLLPSLVRLVLVLLFLVLLSKAALEK